MEHNKNNPKDEIDKLLYDYFKTHNEDVPIETSKAIDEALYKKKHKKHSSFKLSKNSSYFNIMLYNDNWINICKRYIKLL